MSCLGNLIWLLTGGLVAAVLWFLAGILVCITIVGIPFGLQCFKMAGLVLAPFGREVDPGHFGVGGLLLNILWIVLLGWELCLAHLAFGTLLLLTIVGIPFGMQHYKLAVLALVPFGARIRD